MRVLRLLFISITIFLHFSNFSFSQSSLFNDAKELANYLKEWQPDLIVVGLPLNMDGTEQQLTLDAKKFGNRIAGRFGVKVEFQDERLTTADAKEQLFSRGGYRNLKKDNIDAESARLIIESFFEQSYQ